jgi:hypothetical protein
VGTSEESSWSGSPYCRRQGRGRSRARTRRQADRPCSHRARQPRLAPARPARILRRHPRPLPPAAAALGPTPGAPRGRRFQLLRGLRLRSPWLRTARIAGPLERDPWACPAPLVLVGLNRAGCQTMRQGLGGHRPKPALVAVADYGHGRRHTMGGSRMASASQPDPARGARGQPSTRATGSAQTVTARDLEAAPLVPAEAREELLALKAGAMFVCARPDGDILAARASARGCTRVIRDICPSFG